MVRVRRTVDRNNWQQHLLFSIRSQGLSRQSAGGVVRESHEQRLIEKRLIPGSTQYYGNNTYHWLKHANMQ